MDMNERKGIPQLEKLQAETIAMQEVVIRELKSEINNLERENRRLKQDLYVWGNR